MTLAGVALLWLLTAGALFRNPIWQQPPTLVTLQSKVDPNAAPWWELTVLPRIGEGIARRIVTYRESAAGPVDAGPGDAGPVFTSAADLASVRGIGPKTLLRIGPHLRFDRPWAASVRARH